MIQPDGSTRLSAQWRWAWVSLLVALVATTVAFRDTAQSMVDLWLRSETFTHCFLVPPIVAWLVWRSRVRFQALPPRPSWLATCALLLVGLIWVLGDLAAVNAVTQLAYVGMLVLCVPALFGLAVARILLFPLAFSFFAVPVGEFLMPMFMDWTADFTVWALRLSGIPVYREGLNFVIPSGNWSVVEACSGIRYLIASFTVGTLYAYLNYQSTQRRMAFMVVSLVVPILANWLRAYMIVILGHVSGNTLAVGVDHLVYGWVFFGIVILAMFFVGARWAQPEQDFAMVSGLSGNSGAQVAKGWRMALSLVAVLATVAMPASLRWWSDQGMRDGSPQWSAPIAGQGGWSRFEGERPRFEPAYLNPALVADAAYARDRQVVGLYLAFYRNQSYQSKLVSSSNVLVRSTDTQWSVVGSGLSTVPLEQGLTTVRSAQLRPLPLQATEASPGLLVWHVYWINGVLTTNDYLAKVYSAVFRLMGRGDESALVLIYAPQGAGNDASASLSGFLRAHMMEITRALRGVKVDVP